MVPGTDLQGLGQVDPKLFPYHHFIQWLVPIDHAHGQRPGSGQTGGGAFAIESTFKLFRADSSEVSTNVNDSDGNNIYWTQHPPSEKFNLKANIE